MQTNFRFFTRIQQWGIHENTPADERRPIELTNQLAILVALLSLLIGLSLLYYFEWGTSVQVALLNSLLYMGILLLSRLGYTQLSRFLISLILPLLALSASVYVKLGRGLAIEEPEYFDTRLIILVSGMIPLAIFGIRRSPLILFLALLPSFLCLLAYDWLHNLYDVGYYQTGHNAQSFAFLRTLFLLMYLLLVSSFLYYKNLLEKSELGLLESHKELAGLYDEVSSQNEELQSQAEEMHTQAEKLSKSQSLLQQAYQIIETQKQVLQEENINLQQHVLEKNELLQNSNIELQHRLDELRQFSYTISHNLRGPVASLLGLFNLFDAKVAHPNNAELIRHAQTTTQALDEVIQDLSKVIQMRDGKQNLELVNLPQLFESLQLTLNDAISASNARIHFTLDVRQLHSIKSYLHSIFYNLLSNAIKYRDAVRPLEIWVESRQENGQHVLEVRDNGIGLDLNRHGQNIFKMYKRFHESREGRGLGLYLVKAQTEALGGRIEIESVPDEGSLFRIFLPIQQG